MLDRLMPLIALRIELVHARRAHADAAPHLSRHNAAQRVEAGTIRRSEGEVISAILVYADLRAFTRMTDTLRSTQLIDVLGPLLRGGSRAAWKRAAATSTS